MRLVVIAVGSQGDVRPFVALGAGLARGGYDVRLASHEEYRGLALEQGIAFEPIAGNPRDIVQGADGQAWLESADRPWQFMLSLSRIAGPILDSLSTDAWRAAQGCDAIIYSLPLAASGYSVAEGLGVPGIPAALYPLHPTGAFPSILAPSLPIKCGPSNWASAFIAAELFWRVFSANHNRWRHESLGLGALPLSAPLRRYEKGGLPFLYGYSEALVTTPARWSASRKVCGYWFADRPAGWQPSPALAAFLDSGPPPLYAGFGSMARADGERETGILLDAARRAGQRIVVAGGWGGLAAGQGDPAAGQNGHAAGHSAQPAPKLPPHAIFVDSVPHDWLFPRVSAAIHHGGAGTTAAACRAGIPSIIAPFFADQFFWANRIQSLGLGPGPIYRRDFTVDALTAAIEIAINDPRIRSSCASVAQRLAGEDGVAAAVEAVNTYLGSVTRRMSQRRSRPGRSGAIEPNNHESNPTG